MKKYLLITSYLLFAVLCFNSCKSSKKTVDEGKEVPEMLLADMAQSITEWDNFSTSGKLSLSGAASFSTSMQLKMFHDKSIIVSIRPLLGIEVAKVYINNDSAVILNKYHHVYTTIHLQEFKHMLPVNLETIQNIILARPFSLDDGTLCANNVKKFSISYAPDGFTLSPRKKQKEFAYEFAINNLHQVVALNVTPAVSQKTYTAQYSDFVDISPVAMASNINISTSIGELDLALHLYLNPSKVKWDSSTYEPLSINKSYRNVTIAEHIELLKSL